MDHDAEKGGHGMGQAASGGAGQVSGVTEGDTGDSAGGRSCAPSGGAPYWGAVTTRTPLETVRAMPIVAPIEASACSKADGEGEAGGAGGNGAEFDPYADRCGCGDLSCADGEQCINAVVELGASCGRPTAANQCFSICGRDTDCAEDELCLPAFAANEVPRCYKVDCRASDDCCKCTVFSGYRSQCHQNAVLRVACL